MESRCKYRDIFGKPGEGVHEFRMFGLAAFDTVLTVLLGLLLAHILKINNLSGILISFLLGIIFHKIFCVKTSFVVSVVDPVIQHLTSDAF